MSRAYKVLGHPRGQPCPRCKAPRFCDGCALCEACHFACPEVDLPHPPPPAPCLLCPACGSAPSHARTCSVTLRAAAN